MVRNGKLNLDSKDEMPCFENIADLFGLQHFKLLAKKFRNSELWNYLSTIFIF